MARLLGFSWAVAVAASEPYSGLESSMSTLFRTADAETRSISPENFTGEKGRGGMSVDGAAKEAARDLGQGWKVSPLVHIAPKATFTLADITGPGAIQQIWMTVGQFAKARQYILRFYWDGEDSPSVECPLGDFFGCGWSRFCQISSLAVCVNPGSGFNCYWPMPFRRHARITLENRSDTRLTIYYQVNYSLAPVPEDAAYFHAQFRRENPLKAKGLYTILDGVKGRGHYVGTYLAWGTHTSEWWGEGEIKFYFDGDTDFPTICGTGTEDYFCGSYGFKVPGADGKRRYTEFTTPYAGMPQVLPPTDEGLPQQRFGLYRWHITDPIRFKQELKVTIQALGWQSGHRYLQLDDDIASVAFWYQMEPHGPFPPLPSTTDVLIGK